MTVTLTNVINVTVNITVNVRHTLKIWQNGNFWSCIKVHHFVKIHTFQKHIQNHPNMLRSREKQLFVFWPHSLAIPSDRSGNSGSTCNFRGYFLVILVLFDISGLFPVISVLSVISRILLIFPLYLHVITLVRKSNIQPT